jgi:exodeoxyribonuclease VII small subunit
MGFCLFNNVAVGVAHARSVYGLKRAAVIDFDVHHGNGTQKMFANDGDLFYASTHQMPLYPGTGAATERGVAGNVLNCPLGPGDGGLHFRAAMSQRILPALAAFRPELIVISAGFDAHRADPLAQLELEEDDYAWVTSELCAAAAELCQGRVVSALEGGYDLAALSACTLEDIVGRLEQGEVDLEDSIALYERGTALKAHCEKKLKSAEARLEKIVLGPEGAPKGTEPADLG